MTQTADEPVVLPDDPSFGPRSRSTTPATARRAGARPDRPLVTLPEEFHRLDGPVFGEDAIGELDDDLTRQHAGEPLGERIIVSGRRARRRRPADPDALVEIWQANAGGRYDHEVDQHPAPLDPNFSGAGRCLTDSEGNWRFVTIKPGAYPWGNHDNAWRPQHIHFSRLRAAFTQRLVTQMYFPGDPLLALDPIFHCRPRPEGARR